MESCARSAVKGSEKLLRGQVTTTPDLLWALEGRLLKTTMTDEKTYSHGEEKQ